VTAADGQQFVKNSTKETFPLHPLLTKRSVTDRHFRIPRISNINAFPARRVISKVDNINPGFRVELTKSTFLYRITDYK
jgi:hypothetical protein